MSLPKAKTTQFPKPWLAGTSYDLAFHRVKALLLDESLYLHHKDPSKILYIEVDASDVGWGACAYQMRNPFEGDPKDEASSNESWGHWSQEHHSMGQQSLDGP